MNLLESLPKNINAYELCVLYERDEVYIGYQFYNSFDHRITVRKRKNESLNQAIKRLINLIEKL